MTKRVLAFLLFATGLLFISCTERDEVLLLQDTPTAELFRIQGLNNRQLIKKLASADYALYVEDLPISYDPAWMTDLAVPLNRFNIIIISPLLELYIDDILATMADDGRILYLGNSGLELQRKGEGRIHGIQPIPNFNDPLFLRYLADAVFSKAVIYDPQVLGNNETLLQGIEHTVSRETVDSPGELRVSFRNLLAIGVDHIMLILSPSDIGHILPGIEGDIVGSSTQIISTVIPITGAVVGGFPYQYDYLISQALHHLQQAHEGDIQILVPFLSPAK